MAFRRILPALRTYSTAFSNQVVCRRLGPISSVKQQRLPVLGCYNRPFSSEVFLIIDLLDMSYEEFDVVVNDINELELEAIGRMCGVKNLSVGRFSSPSFPVKGEIMKRNTRFMVPLVCQRAGKPKNPVVNVWFLLDTNSPFTCLTKKTMRAILGPKAEIVDNDRFKIAIQDQQSNVECQVSKPHFKEVNILGADALSQLKLWIRGDWKNKEFQLYQQE